MRVQFKRILCATDFSDLSNHALPYAIALARKYKAKLHVCHAVEAAAADIYETTPYVLVEFEKKLADDAHRQIDQLMAKAEIEWLPLVLSGPAAYQIPLAVEENDIDLVVLATHGRSGFKRMLLGSVTERLVKVLPCPILVVRSPEREFVTPADQEIALRRILVGCDFSSDSAAAVEHALSLAQEFQTELHLVHVLEPNIYEQLLASGGKLAEDLKQTFEDTVKTRLQDLVSRERHPWCEVRTATRRGLPHEELDAYAEKSKIDLIVLGIHGRNLLERLLLGSTTDRVLRRAPCPVLCVREPESSKPEVSREGAEE